VHIEIVTTDFDPWQTLQAHQARKAAALHGKIGATCSFVGTMRDFNEGERVHSMLLEHYPGMTEKQLGLIITEATRQWSVLDGLVIHKVGEVFPQQPIVLVAVWTARRGDAFDACRHIIEGLKSHAPFWKKETLASQHSRWVEKNSSGYMR
jgi:molybdopterin synthase catalytic subunit